MEDGRDVRERRMVARPQWLVPICGAILFVSAYPFVPAIHQFLLGPSLSEMILSLVLFLAVFAIFSWIVPRTLHVTAERRGIIEGGLENAEETNSEARQLLEEHRISVSGAQLEAARIREEAREHGAQIISEAREQALMDARQVVEDAAGKIQESRTNSLTELHPQVAQIAIKLSERIIGEPPYELSQPEPRLPQSEPSPTAPPTATQDGRKHKPLLRFGYPSRKAAQDAAQHIGEPRGSKKLAAVAGVPVICLREGGRHTGDSLMQDAGVDQELWMREVGHADKSVSDRYTHPLEHAHLAAAEQTAGLSAVRR